MITGIRPCFRVCPERRVVLSLSSSYFFHVFNVPFFGYFFPGLYYSTPKMLCFCFPIPKPHSIVFRCCTGADDIGEIVLLFLGLFSYPGNGLFPASGFVARRTAEHFANASTRVWLGSIKPFGFGMRKHPHSALIVVPWYCNLNFRNRRGQVGTPLAFLPKDRRRRREGRVR